MKKSDIKLIKEYNKLSYPERDIFFRKHEDEIHTAYMEFYKVKLFRPNWPDTNKKIHLYHENS